MKNTRKGTIRFLYRAVVFMNRIEVVKGIAGKIIEATLPKDRQAACIHLYGVAQACALLALRRGQDVELAVTAGLLHDLHTYRTGNPADHAHQGAALARELLSPTGLFTPDEIEKISAANYAHSDKAARHNPFTEVLVDADVLQHCLFTPTQPPALQEAERFRHLCAELGASM